MKVILTISLLVLAVCGLPQIQEWVSFKQKHGKLYKTLAEEQYRFQIFLDNLKTINEHNEKYIRGESSFKMGINKFSDMTPEEMKKFRGLNGRRPNIEKNVKPLPKIDIPDSFDWRPKGAVLQVKNQGDGCGSCWAFGATGAIEGQNFIKNNISLSLSEQELMDCSYLYGNSACSGGYPENAFEYVKDLGLHSDEEYPYTAQSQLGNCPSFTNPPAVRLSAYYSVKPTEEALKAAIVTIGPISVKMDASRIQNYISGIYDDPKCLNNPFTLDHAPLAVGYGSENGVDYWIVKNSWGADWGEDGYIRLKRNESVCGILLDSFYPELA